MKKLFHKFRIVILSIIGCFIKFFLNIHFGKSLNVGINQSEERKNKVIISLTSYGRRVGDILPYTIYSLLKQSYKPDMVVLWLDHDNWNEDNIPDKLKLLKEKGLTIRFCKDLKSYKKHVPALADFPNDLVITTDDDFYYSKDFVARLMKEFELDRNRIYTHRAHLPIIKSGQLLPYEKWNKLVYNREQSPLFPTTGGGCLFQKRLLHSDALKEELFTKLCPTADDIWFYMMTVLQKTPIKVLPFKEFTLIPLDFFYQMKHRGSSLQHVNRGALSMNDKQIIATMENYNLNAQQLLY